MVRRCAVRSGAFAATARCREGQRGPRRALCSSRRRRRHGNGAAAPEAQRGRGRNQTRSIPRPERRSRVRRSPAAALSPEASVVFEPPGAALSKFQRHRAFRKVVAARRFADPEAQRGRGRNQTRSIPRPERRSRVPRSPAAALSPEASVVFEPPGAALSKLQRHRAFRKVVAARRFAAPDAQEPQHLPMDRERARHPAELVREGDAARHAIAELVEAIRRYRW